MVTPTVMIEWVNPDYTIGSGPYGTQPENVLWFGMEAGGAERWLTANPPRSLLNPTQGTNQTLATPTGIIDSNANVTDKNLVDSFGNQDRISANYINNQPKFGLMAAQGLMANNLEPAVMNPLGPMIYYVTRDGNRGQSQYGIPENVLFSSQNQNETNAFFVEKFGNKNPIAEPPPEIPEVERPTEPEGRPIEPNREQFTNDEGIVDEDAYNFSIEKYQTDKEAYENSTEYVTYLDEQKKYDNYLLESGQIVPSVVPGQPQDVGETNVIDYQAYQAANTQMQPQTLAADQVERIQTGTDTYLQSQPDLDAGGRKVPAYTVDDAAQVTAPSIDSLEQADTFTAKDQTAQDATTITADLVSGEVLDQTLDQTRAAISEGPTDTVQAQTGQLTGRAREDVTFDPSRIEKADEDAVLTVDPTKEIVDGQKRDTTAEGIAQTSQYVSAIDAAKYDEAKIPEARPQDQYLLGDIEGETREVTEDEIVKSVDARDPDTIKSPESVAGTVDEQETVKAVEDTVAKEELIGTAKDTYDLDKTKIAEIEGTTVSEAATGKAPSTKEPEYFAKTDAESKIPGETRAIDTKELVDIEKNIGTLEEIETVAATMNTLNEQAKMKAASGTFNQDMEVEVPTATLSAKATLMGQMDIWGSKLDVPIADLPSWAKAQMKVVNEQMAKRGLQGSSMANAAMIGALNASVEAKALRSSEQWKEVELKNIDNRMQAAIANQAAQLNIELKNMDFEQNASLQNSTNAFALQASSLSNEQAVVLANFQMKAAVQRKNIDIKAMAATTNAARYAELNNINLSNQQQGALQESAENLQIDIANLRSEEKTAIANLQVSQAILGQNVSNEQAMAVLESTQVFEAANFNANAKQKAFLQDAAAQAALEGKALDVRHATSLFNAKRFADLNDQVLDAKQQSYLRQSAINLEVDTTNANIETQNALANAQIRAALQGKILNGDQQQAILNSEAYRQANDITVSNKQQALIQAFVSKATLEGKAVDVRQQTQLFNIGQALDRRKDEFNAKQETALYNNTQNLNVDLTNVGNRQQMALANAQIDAALGEIELSNKQQAAVLNADRYAEAANLTFSREEKAVLHNSNLMQSIGNIELTASQAAVLQNSARVADMDIANLDNRQQAEVLNAKAFLEIDLANLSNEQQIEVIQSQQRVEALFNDQALQNAVKNFNAETINDTMKFFSNLSQQNNQFNATEKNNTERMNIEMENKAISLMAELGLRADEVNVEAINTLTSMNTEVLNNISKFNAELTSQRELYYHNNEVEIAKNNTNWTRETNTADTAAKNAAITMDVQNTLAVQQKALNQVFDHYETMLDYAFKSDDNDKNRAANLVIATLQAELSAAADEEESQNNLISSIFTAGATLLSSKSGNEFLGGFFEGLF